MKMLHFSGCETCRPGGLPHKDIHLSWGCAQRWEVKRTFWAVLEGTRMESGVKGEMGKLEKGRRSGIFYLSVNGRLNWRMRAIGEW